MSVFGFARRAQATAGNIVLVYGDGKGGVNASLPGSRQGPQRGADLRVPAPGQAKKTAMGGALGWTTRQSVVTRSRINRSTDASRSSKPSMIFTNPAQA